MTGSILRGENPVTLRSQTDNIAGLQRTIPGPIDLDESLALASTQLDFGALGWPKYPDMADRSLKRAGTDRPDLHVVTPDKQFGCAGNAVGGGDTQRLSAKRHATLIDLHRQHDRFPDEPVHECRCGIVVNF